MEQANTSVFRVEPHGFSPVVETAACYIESEGKLLLLKRTTGKAEGDRWGVPGGKIEKEETARQAAIREVCEETYIQLDEELLKFVGKLFIRKPDVDYVFYMFQYEFCQIPAVSLNDEHQDYTWVTIEEAHELPLMSGGTEALHHFRALNY